MPAVIENVTVIVIFNKCDVNVRIFAIKGEMTNRQQNTAFLSICACFHAVTETDQREALEVMKILTHTAHCVHQQYNQCQTL